MQQQSSNGTAGFDAWAHSLLRELEQQTPEAIRRQRSAERQAVRINVTIRPGNSSERGPDADIAGVTGDVSSNGAGLMTSRPIRVGDVYQLVFEKGELDLPIVYARCMRCRVVREDAFESGFSFFDKITLTPTDATDDTKEGLL
ncbi:MAG: PilZ domain-containing protein [Planctomycetota bacterium]